MTDGKMPKILLLFPNPIATIPASSYVGKRFKQNGFDVRIHINTFRNFRSAERMMEKGCPALCPGHRRAVIRHLQPPRRLSAPADVQGRRVFRGRRRKPSFHPARGVPGSRGRHRFPRRGGIRHRRFLLMVHGRKGSGEEARASRSELHQPGRGGGSQSEAPQDSDPRRPRRNGFRFPGSRRIPRTRRFREGPQRHQLRPRLPVPLFVLFPQRLVPVRKEEPGQHNPGDGQQEREARNRDLRLSGRDVHGGPGARPQFCRRIRSEKLPFKWMVGTRPRASTSACSASREGCRARPDHATGSRCRRRHAKADPEGLHRKKTHTMPLP
jgi:hypothetical protein